MRNKLMALCGLALLAACTPADEQYCNNFGVAGTAEYGKCIGYYHQQEQIFGADRAACSYEADMTYPQSLYDHGTMAQAPGTFWAGQYQPPQIIDIPPDYQHNLEVDRLRARIIDPCMSAKGWNSGSTWQAGRHAVVVAPRKVVTPQGATPSMNSLPWLH